MEKEESPALLLEELRGSYSKEDEEEEGDHPGIEYTLEKSLSFLNGDSGFDFDIDDNDNDIDITQDSSSSSSNSNSSNSHASHIITSSTNTTSGADKENTIMDQQTLPDNALPRSTAGAASPQPHSNIDIFDNTIFESDNDNDNDNYSDSHSDNKINSSTSCKNGSMDIINTNNSPSDEHDHDRDHGHIGMVHSVSFTTNKSTEDKQDEHVDEHVDVNVNVNVNTYDDDDDDNKSLVSEMTFATNYTSNASVSPSIASYLNETDRSKERLRKLRQRRFARESSERGFSDDDVDVVDVSVDVDASVNDDGNGNDNDNGGNDNDTEKEQTDVFMEKNDNADIYDDDCAEEDEATTNTNIATSENFKKPISNFKNGIEPSFPPVVETESTEGGEDERRETINTDTNTDTNTPQHSPMGSFSAHSSPKHTTTATPPSSPAEPSASSPSTDQLLELESGSSDGAMNDSLSFYNTPTRNASSSSSSPPPPSCPSCPSSPSPSLSKTPPPSPPTPSIQNSAAATDTAIATTPENNYNDNTMNSPCLSEINVQPMNSIMKDITTDTNTDTDTDTNGGLQLRNVHNDNDVSQLGTTDFEDNNNNDNEDDDDDDTFENANYNSYLPASTSKSTRSICSNDMDAFNEVLSQTQELVDSIQKSSSFSRGGLQAQVHVDPTSQGGNLSSSQTSHKNVVEDKIENENSSSHTFHDSHTETTDMKSNNDTDSVKEEEKKEASSDSVAVENAAVATKQIHDEYGPTSSQQQPQQQQPQQQQQQQQQLQKQLLQPNQPQIPVLATQQEPPSLQNTTAMFVNAHPQPVATQQQPAVAGISQDQLNTILQTPPLYTTTTNGTNLISLTSATAATAHLNQQEQIVYIGNGNSVVAAHPHAQHHQIQLPNTAAAAAPSLTQQIPTRRSMKLRLQEEIKPIVDQSKEDSKKKKKKYFGMKFSTVRRATSSSSVDTTAYNKDEVYEKAISDMSSPPPVRVDRGVVSISWYEGTTTVELQEHVRTSVERKLRIGSKKLLRNFRVIDETIQPNEEIVLSSYIPNGSEFLCRFRIKDNSAHWKPHYNRAPDSPSAAPSPPGELERLQEQIKMIVESEKHSRPKLFLPNIEANGTKNEKGLVNPKPTPLPGGNDGVAAHNEQLSQRLEKLSETLLHLHEDGPYARVEEEPVDKRQVVFTICNYFILFLSLIAISAEIDERAPRWIAWINENVTSVQNCAADRDALFECVSEGNISGLVASIILWGTTSVATRQFFLFGFDSPQKLWTVVYESGVTSFCWGCSYMLIRRGLNPDTRPNFIHKYWKDAVYGSLAGFNAAFMKAVLKNLIPQEQMLDVLDQRQLRIVSFLGNILKGHNGPGQQGLT